MFAPAVAQARHFHHAYHPRGFRLSSSNYVVHENAGAAVITITRASTRRAGQIGYITLPGSAMGRVDFTPVKSIIDFRPGESSATFRIPIVDHHLPGITKTVKIGMFDGFPIGLSRPHKAILRIINDDPVSFLRNPLNPLGLIAQPPASDPLMGALAYIDWKNESSARLARRWRHRHPKAAGMLRVIATQPEVYRFGTWTGRHPGIRASQYLEEAARLEPRRIPELSTYYLPGHGCNHYSDPPSRQRAFHNWIRSLAAGIGGHRAILFLEFDAVMTVGCLNRHGRAVRMHELRAAISVLSRLPHLVVYLDGGAADALSARRTAQLLRQAGVSAIQGFFLNSTHFDWTSREIRYGNQISRMIGGKHFVVNTAENGRGPLKPPNPVRQGNEILCNPPGRGLGPKPTFNTGFPNVDAFAWIAHPGESGGACRPGAPPVGHFWPAWALALVRNADFQVR